MSLKTNILGNKGKVLKYLQEIPKWKVTTYKRIWDKFSIHPRAVSVYMKYNERPDLYPCFKVIKSNLEVWWYSWEDGVDWKIKRLKKEGIRVVKWKIDKKYIY